VTSLLLQQRLLARLLAAKVRLPFQRPLVEEIRGQQQLQLLSVVDQEELPLYRFWLQVVALERQQLQQPQRLVVEQQLLQQLQLLQRTQRHEIYPTSKPLSMLHLL
jgi:hypothetical protein